MDSVAFKGVTSAGGSKCRVNKKKRDWHKRLHLRKTAVHPPTMQNEDKHGPKIAEEWEQSTACPSSKKPPRGGKEHQHGTNDSGNTLRFTCSQCKDNLEYVPKDLVRHFEEKHRGSSPVFLCHMCTFSTHEFSYLQVHLLSHKDTFSSCSVCNDNVQRTWPEFSAHLSTFHCQNGKYSCEMCQKFSTGDIEVFLEHLYAHNLGLERVSDDLLLHTKNENKSAPKTTTQTLHCQHCGYEASKKLLITKHIKEVHVCSNGNQTRKKKEVHSIAGKPNDPIPKMKPRLTRSAVREMCWLTQDCLSLPGREFLDKYCHLSDPQTTLEETQQFLMKSVAGETGNQKWTKALKTVLSNVPQEVNLHPKSENGIMSNSSDLTVLTVKNKITVAQNGGAYAKKLKMMTSSDKETASTESAPDDARVIDQNGHQSNWNDRTLCPQADAKLNDVSQPAQSETSECCQIQENRENQELTDDQEIEECGKKHEEAMHEDGINNATEFKLMHDGEEQKSALQVLPKNKRRNRRRRRKARSKNASRRSSGSPLKIVLKKNPVKDEQWVSQSSLSPSGGGAPDEPHGLPSTRATFEEKAQILQTRLQAEAPQNKRTKASETDLQHLSADITMSPKPGGEVKPTAKPIGSKNIDGNMPVIIKGVPETDQEMQDDDKSLRFMETDAHTTGADERTDQSQPAAVIEKVQLQTSGSATDFHVPDNERSPAAEGVIPNSSHFKSSPVSQPVVIPQGNTNSRLALSSEHSVEGVRDTEVPADDCLHLLSNTNLPAVKTVQQEPSPTAGNQRQLVPKNLERNLKLVAINPYQLVKRPAGNQPVVVLNHPDADIPEVARIMEVVNRYRGEVQRVILSRRTSNALSAMNGEVPQQTEPTDAQSDCARHGRNAVQERFMLKLKLRRLSRKKYEVVDGLSPSRDAVRRYRCWFCGRVFTSQETWMIHRQRHLMDWK